MNYENVIDQSVLELLALEQKAKHGKVRCRLNLLRQLKSGYSLKRSSALAGLGYRQSQRIIQRYRAGGLAQAIELGYSSETSNAARFTSEQIEQLKERLKQSDIGGLKQAQAYIEQTFNYSYSLSGLSTLFARHKIKLKTGRPQAIEQDPEQMEAFKKTLAST